MASPSTKEDMITTTGNSDDVRIVPNPEPTKLISIALLLVGSVLAANILFQEPLALSWQGSFWGMLAALSFSTFVFLSGSIEKETPPILKSALLSTGGALTVFIVFPPTLLFDLDVLMGFLMD